MSTVETRVKAKYRCRKCGAEFYLYVGEEGEGELHCPICGSDEVEFVEYATE